MSRINEPYAAVSREKHFWKFWGFEKGNIISSSLGFGWLIVWVVGIYNGLSFLWESQSPLAFFKWSPLPFLHILVPFVSVQCQVYVFISPIITLAVGWGMSQTLPCCLALQNCCWKSHHQNIGPVWGLKGRGPLQDHRPKYSSKLNCEQSKVWSFEAQGCGHFFYPVPPSQGRCVPWWLLAVQLS